VGGDPTKGGGGRGVRRFSGTLPVHSKWLGMNGQGAAVDTDGPCSKIKTGQNLSYATGGGSGPRYVMGKERRKKTAPFFSSPYWKRYFQVSCPSVMHFSQPGRKGKRGWSFRFWLVVVARLRCRFRGRTSWENRWVPFWKVWGKDRKGRPLKTTGISFVVAESQGLGSSGYEESQGPFKKGKQTGGGKRKGREHLLVLFFRLGNGDNS